MRTHTRECRGWATRPVRGCEALDKCLLEQHGAVPVGLGGRVANTDGERSCQTRAR